MAGEASSIRCLMFVVTLENNVTIFGSSTPLVMVSDTPLGEVEYEIKHDFGFTAGTVL